MNLFKSYQGAEDQAQKSCHPISSARCLISQMQQVKRIKKSSGLLPNKSDAPSEKVKNSSGDLDDIKKVLVTTIDTVEKEGTTETVKKKEKKPNFLEEATTSPISTKNKFDTVNKKDKSQA